MLLILGTFGSVAVSAAEIVPGIPTYTYTTLGDENIENQVVVLYDEDHKDRSGVSLLSEGVEGVRKTSETVDVVEFSGLDNAELEAAMDELRAQDGVLSVGRNFMMQYYGAPDDANYNLQWYYSRIGAEDLWDVAPGSKTVTVAVIDSGLDTAHEDIKGRYLTGYDYIRRNTSMTDTFGHGTAVSSVIAATVNNGVGMAGVAGLRNIKIVPYRAGATKGITIDYAVAAIEKAITAKADIINMSFGFYLHYENGTLVKTLMNTDKVPMYTVLKKAASKGIVLVAASGNENGAKDDYGNALSGVYSYPSSYDNVISVGATTMEKKIASFSQYNNRVDLSAPGQSITVALPGNQYEIWHGTSFAAPIVAASAAVLKTYHPAITSKEIEALLKGTATDLGAKGRDNYHGNGEVNLKKAVENMYPTSVKMSAATVSVPMGTSEAAPLVPTPSYAVTSGSTWSSSDTKIATVSSAGVIKGIAPGTCTISVKTLKGLTAQVDVKVFESVSLRVGYSKNIVNGVKGTIADGVKPQIVKTRTMVPIRFVTASLGCKVTWVANDKPITVKYGDTLVTCKVGSKTMTVKYKDGTTKNVALDSPPVLLGSPKRVYVPLRAIGQSLGFGVYYDNATRIILVSKPAQPNALMIEKLLPAAKSYIK